MEESQKKPRREEINKVNGPVSPPRAFQIGAWVIIAMCVLYAPLAATQLFGSTAEDVSVWTHVLAELAGDELAHGDNSVHTVQQPLYYEHLLSMRIHTLFAGLCLLTMLPQFSSRLRLRYPGLHRWGGRVSVSFGAVSMIGALSFLLSTSLDQSYSGKAFGAGLWIQLLLTVVALSLGVFHIRRRQVQQHQAWMVLAFCFLLIAPVLRIFWIALARLDPSMRDAWNNNQASTVVVTAFSIFPALCWQSYGNLAKPLAHWKEAVAQQRQRAFGGVALVAALVSVQEGILRFAGVPDVFGDALSLPGRAEEAAAFAHAPAGFILGTIGLLASLGGGARLLPEILTGRDFSELLSHRLLIGGLLVAGLGYMMQATAVGETGALGVAGPYFYGGCGLLLIVVTVLAWGHARRRFEVARLWALHGIALSTVPFLSVACVPNSVPFGLSPGESWRLSCALAMAIPMISVYLMSAYQFANKLPSKINGDPREFTV